MELLYTYNTEQLTTGSFTAAAASAARVNIDTLPGVVGTAPVLFARVFYSWTALTAGGAAALTVAATALPTSAAAASQVNYLYSHGVASYSTAHTAAAVTSTLASGSAAAGSEWVEFFADAYSSASGALIPFPAYWCVFFGETGASAWTAGTFTIDKIELYG